ncbi:MAG TPA: GNAT family N-acetyltransferase [Anaerolineales bacterium]|nr:GNAT family N-acetyltransferase [Anaerolineales bacterium]
MKIRAANLEDCPGIARVQVDSYRTAYAGLLPGAYLDHFTYQGQEQDWLDLLSADPDQVLHVAETPSGEIVGYGLARPNSGDMFPYDSELVALHLRNEHQQRGVGRQLLKSVSKELHRRGGRSLFVWVLAENPARQFYEKQGGNYLGQKPWQNNEYFATDIDEVAYGWGDIRSLIA